MNKLGAAFSQEVIDSCVLPTVPENLLPWLLRDKKEALEGCTVKDSKGNLVHDGSGLERAKQSLHVAEGKLAEGHTDAKIINFLREQRGMAQGKVDFYTGKLYLMDKIIEQTRKNKV